MKRKKELEIEGHVCYWLTYLQLTKKLINLDKKCHSFELSRSEYEIALCANHGHIFAKVYKILKLNWEKEYVKDYVSQWAKNLVIM